MRLRASCRAPGLATRAAAVALCLAALAPSRAAGDEAGPHLKAAWPGAEDKERTKPLETVPENQPANATSATIPGTGRPVKDLSGQEAKRNVRT